MTKARSCSKTRRNLPLSPEIGTNFPAREFPITNSMNFQGSVLSPPPATAFNFVQEGHAKREAAVPGPLPKSQPFIRSESAGEDHGSNLDTLSNLVNPRRIGLFVEQWDDFVMGDDAFPKRGMFREWVAEAKAKLGATNNAAVAPLLGIAPTSLNKYLGKSPTHKPSPEALKLLGDFLGRDYRVLLDDPIAAPSGIAEERWADADEDTQILLSALFEELMNFPPDEQARYVKHFKEGMALGKARIAEESAKIESSHLPQKNRKS